MTAFLTSAKASLILYKLAIFRGLLYSAFTLISAFLTAVQTVDFPSLTRWQQFCILLGVFSTWSTVMLAFIDSTIKKLSSEVTETPTTEIKSP